MNEKNVFQSLAIIEENIREKLTVEKLAESLHFSKYHYQRLFREAVGDSVMRYVTGRKLTLAAADLIETDDTVLEIALKYGYDSHEGFTRSFRAYIGVTPTEYRKFHSDLTSPETKAEKEKSAMLYSKSADEVIRELNSLIVQAKETAEHLRKNKSSDPEIAAWYSDFWDYIADKTDAMAGTLTETLERITTIAKRPDEITARFIIIKTVEDAVFQLNLITFQTGLTISRAKPGHRPALNAIGDRFSALSHNARIKSVKIAGLFNELTGLIFGDIRSSAEEKINGAVKKGREAAKLLEAAPDRCYTYIKEEIDIITKELYFTTLEKVTSEFLEDLVFRLDIIAFSADMDMLRNPSDKPLLEGITEFKEQLSETAEFFGSLSDDIVSSFENDGNSRAALRTERKKYGDLAFQENILLFYLKGEVQKLEPYLNKEQKSLFDKIYEKMNIVIRLANHSDYIDVDISAVLQKEMAENMKSIYSDLTAIKEELGDYGSAIGYIAEELRQCSFFRCVTEGDENVWL